MAAINGLVNQIQNPELRERIQLKTGQTLWKLGVLMAA